MKDPIKGEASRKYGPHSVRSCRSGEARQELAGERLTARSVLLAMLRGEGVSVAPSTANRESFLQVK